MEWGFSQSQDINTQHNASSVARLRRAWLNEQCSPELLTFESELVESITAMIEQQEQTISDNNEENFFLSNIYQMEVERVKYIVRQYLRVRLSKIDKYWLHLTKDESLRSKLSTPEIIYLQKFSGAVLKHINDSFLQFIPEKMRSAEEDTMVISPNLDTFVFCKINEDIGAVEVDPVTEQTHLLQQRDTWVLKYRPIQRLLEEGKVDLV